MTPAGCGFHIPESSTGQHARPIPTGHILTSCGRLSIEATRTESIARGSAVHRTVQLGIHISVAAAWQRASAADWTHYAAGISRRHNTNTGVTGENC